MPISVRPRRSLYESLRWWIGGDGTSGRTDDERSILQDLGYTVLWLAGVISAAVISVGALAIAQTPLIAAALIGMCGIVALASAAVGGMLGFLFGIPRTLADDGGSGDNKVVAEARYTRSNTNLEQVSDWLTKILIGATLVEVKSIGPGLIAIGAFVEVNFVKLPGLGQLRGIGGLVPILIVLSFCAGFLTLYLQTRTFLAIMFARTEHVMGDPKLARAEIDVLKEAARQVALEGRAAKITPATLELARRALGQHRPSEANPEALKQRGFAQVVIGQVGEGATTLKQAYELTGDEELARMVSRLLARAQRPGEAKDLLRQVQPPPPGVQITEADADALLARMFASLYEPPPFGFEDALRIGQSLRGQPVVTGSQKRRGRLELYTAAALGQSHKQAAASDDSSRCLQIRADALKAVQDALAADATQAPSLKRMLIGDGEDDDLTSFKEDPNFKELLGA